MNTFLLNNASILWKSDTKTREDIHAKDKGWSKKTTKPNTPNYIKIGYDAIAISQCKD